MNVFLPLNRLIANYLEKQTKGYVALDRPDSAQLRAVLQPGDVLLVEGDRRISIAIKYLTQSTWSHAAMYMGDGEGRDVIEADLREGVRYAPLSSLCHLNLRICRPVALGAEDMQNLLDHMRGRLGNTYDLRNVVDLARFLLPQPPVPRRFRRRMLAFGSGDATRAICSTLIAQAFQSIRYPILPKVEYVKDDMAEREILHIKHYSLFTPRDFDLSPYFQVVKPRLHANFNFHTLTWADTHSANAPQTAKT